MTRQRTMRRRVALVIAVASMLGLALQARQPDSVAELRDRLRERYDVLVLQDGIGLVPRRESAVRIIEIRGGAVAINGDEVTGRELRERLGPDADLILRVTYLNGDEQRQLASAARPAAPETPATAQPAPAPAERSRPGTEAERRVRRDGDVVRIIGNVTVPRDERVDGDVVVVFGNAYVDGEVDGAVTVFMGNLYLGETALVGDDVNVIGGLLNRAPGARIEGSIHGVGRGAGRWRWNFPAMLRDTVLGRVGSLAGTLFRVTFLALLSLIVVAFGRNTIERIADRTAADPLRAGLVGVFAQLLFFPLLVIAVIVLAISIIGIPLLLLLPFVFLLVLITLVVGFTGVAYQVGRLLHDRFGWTGRGTYPTVILGVVTIVAVTVIARSAAIVGGSLLSFPLSAVGYFVEYAAWTLGLGAAILVWIRRRDMPPPLPV